MENGKQVGGSYSSGSSFTVDLFGPKDSSPSTTLFGSVFGPNSTGLGKDSSHSKYGSAKHGTPDYKTQRSKGESGIGSKERNSTYQNGTAEPCYFSSSIYYGGQEVYSPNSQSNNSHHVFKKDGGDELYQFKKDGGDEDPNGSNASGASRGNWWQGSLYY